ncbi:F0F1 ATP synthase subunit A [Candidatus Hydrogenosomobacter endosymbioticus]|uniref:ATP synthase subunit a n=1 Tax=Candidatus Hydrogenosomobacter endosymbioticus TaxID=2558174 RepID=A0ABN6L2B1_9PROT|nr:F0F1 ATP synthase subunit A [Candidatus Hydrogenosomobacter endosymbioticus]BDB96013.1 ATP synthase subunit a [Candidatus Hydrogenosomobacter endosymbioticus]
MHPLKQFEIHTLIPIDVFGIDLSFTNAAAFMMLAAVLPSAFFLFCLRCESIVPGRVQSVGEMFFYLVYRMLSDISGEKGVKFFPLIFSIFMFILAGNVLGMLPWAFTFTSQVIADFALALAVVVAITVAGIVVNGNKFFRVFLPRNVPIWISPILLPIEIISYFIKPLSLSGRLFVNMTAGHIMLKVFAHFIVSIGVFGVVPLAVAIVLTALEFFVALLQAYVFTIMSCIYLNDALHPH